MANAGKRLRIFTAICLNESLINKLARLTSELRATLGTARWVRPENLHVTLLFLGSVDPSSVRDISGGMKRLANTMAPWRARVRGVGAFPALRSPRVLWAGLEGEPERFKALYAGLADRLAPFCEKVEKRAYTPHITLARFKGKPEVRLEEVIGRYSEKEWGELTIGELTLFESRLSPKGAEYAPLCRVRLGAE